MKSTLQEWNEFIQAHPEAHILQSGAWGELKSAFGWKAEHIRVGDSGAQVLFRTLPGGFSFGYIPKGPVGQDWDCLLPELDALCRENKAIFLKVEPDIWEKREMPAFFHEKSWRRARPIQPRRTIIVPIQGTEDEILAAMKQKTRYNIRLAEKKDITVELSTDLGEFQRMMTVTGKRDGIGVHAQQYYQRAYDLFYPEGKCDLLFACYQGQPLAGIMVFAQGKTAWYMYGASTDLERNRMPTYLLQWQAMRWARQKGCVEYDLWGIPDLNDEELEEFFTRKESHQGLWGVYRFKRGFGGQSMRSVGAWDRVYFPGLYNIYLQVMKLRGSREE